jgi:hypothetical protein
MIRRASVEDAEQVNDWIWRDSGTRPDFHAFLADHMNVCLISGDGGAIFVWRGPGIYEVHLFLEQRGRAALNVMQEMFALMREHGAKQFWAAIPSTSRHVIMFARWCGWKPQGQADLIQGRCELFTGE